MVDEGSDHKGAADGGGSNNISNSTSSKSADGGVDDCGEITATTTTVATNTSESTVVVSTTNLLLSSSSASANEFSHKSNEERISTNNDTNANTSSTQPRLFEHIISNYQDCDETSNLDDEKFEKIENLNDTHNNSFEMALNGSFTNTNTNTNSICEKTSGDCLMESQNTTELSPDEVISIEMGMLNLEDFFVVEDKIKF